MAQGCVLLKATEAVHVRLRVEWYKIGNKRTLQTEL
jgi:hypothetical protein